MIRNGSVDVELCLLYRFTVQGFSVAANPRSILAGETGTRLPGLGCPPKRWEDGLELAEAVLAGRGASQRGGGVLSVYSRFTEAIQSIRGVFHV